MPGSAARSRSMRLISSSPDCTSASMDLRALLVCSAAVVAVDVRDDSAVSRAPRAWGELSARAWAPLPNRGSPVLLLSPMPGAAARPSAASTLVVPRRLPGLGAAPSGPAATAAQRSARIVSYKS